MFDPRIFYQPGTVELVESLRNQEWMHSFEKPISSMFENKVRILYHQVCRGWVESNNNGARIKMELNEEILANILDIPIVGIKSVKNHKLYLEFIQIASKVEGTSTVRVKKIS